MMKKLIHKTIMEGKSVGPSAWIAMTCVACLLVLSVWPAVTGCSAAEEYLCFVIPAIAVSGFAISFKRRIGVKGSPADLIVAGWYLYSMCRLWLGAAYPAGGFAAKSTLMLMLYASYRILFSSSGIKCEAVALLLAVFAFVEACMGYSQLISGASRHYLYPVTGSFLNPGPYSAYLAVGVVSVCALKRNPCNISIVVLTVLSVPLVMTMSRAAFLSLAVCLLLLYKDKIKGWLLPAFLVAALAAAAVALYFVKSGSAEGRGIINYIGANCILQSPLFGSGIGSFFHSYALQTAEISADHAGIDLTRGDVIDYSYNDLLRVGVEQGLVGLAFAVALIAVTMRSLWIAGRPLFFAALSLLVISLFLYPFELLPYQIVGALLAAYAGTARQGGMVYGDGCRKWRDTAKAIAVIAVFCVVSTSCYRYIQSRRTAEKEYGIISGLHDKAFTNDYYSLLPYLQDDKHFLFDFAGLLSEQGRYNDGNDMLRRGELVSNDPMFIVLQGNNYRDMGAYEEAEAAYIRAWHTMPNRIYPLYRLMKLHEQLGNAGKASAYAGRVAAFKEKIPSPAVAEMKKEAREVIKKYQGR